MTTRSCAGTALAGFLAFLSLGLADRETGNGVYLLPMDGVAVAPLAPGVKDVVADVSLRTYRVNQESRPARVVKAPARISRTITVPGGGGRFETFLAPLKHPVVMAISVDGGPPARFEAPAGRWTPVLGDLPPGARTAHIVETLEGPPGSLVLWGDDRVAPKVPKRGAPDVIVISLDTVRPDYLTPYAPGETTTPVLARLAQESMRFDQAISVSSWTTPAHAALFTGRFPGPGLGFTERLEPRELTLAEIFAAAGYNTHGSSGGPCIDAAFGFQQGFRTYHDSAESKNAVAMTDWALARVTRSLRGAPLFLFLNYFDAHELNTGVTGPEWQAADLGTVKLEGKPLEHLRDAYRHDLAVIDRQLGRLFEAMKQSRDWSNTIVVVVGDHGQLLGERGFVGHGFTLDEELIRVPLIVKGLPSSQFAGRQYLEQFQMTDVFSLILELAGRPVPGAAPLAGRIAAGQPVRSLTFAEYHQPPRPEVTSLRRWQSDTLQAVRTDTTKIVRDAEGRITTFRVGNGAQAVVPRFSLTEQLAGELGQLHREGTAATGRPLDLPRDVVARLRALGYIR